MISPLVTVLAVVVAVWTLQDTIDTGNKQQKLANEQQELAYKQQDLAEQGQITDRFTRAVDQLGQEGDDKMAIRLGGIYALDRIMADSPRDRPSIIAVLSAFVRIHTKQAEDDPQPDVQATLTVLAQRPEPDKPGNKTVDWTLAKLDGAHLEEAHLNGAQLIGTNLIGAYMRGAHLDGARMYRARPGKPPEEQEGAYMHNVKLPDAHLVGTDLRYVTLTCATLTGADLTDAIIDATTNLTNATIDARTKIQLPPGVTIRTDPKVVC